MGLKENYITIYESFYEVVEQDYLLSLRSQFEYSLSLKDINLLFAIQKEKKDFRNYSSLLAKKIGATHSTFSNHLKILERYKIIRRYRDPSNYKHMLIDLDLNGIAYYEILIQFYQGLFEYFKTKFSNLKLLDLIKTIIHISNTFSEEEPKLKKPSILNIPSFNDIYEAFNRIYFYNFNQENDFLTHYELDIDLTDLKLLTLTYLYEEEGLNQPSTLSEKTSMQFSTISSIIHQLDKDGFVKRTIGDVDKRKLNIVLETHTKKIVEDYMMFRIHLHEEIKTSVPSKQFELIKKAYQYIKDYTQEYKQKARQ